MIYNLVSNEFHNNMSYETTKGNGIYSFGSIVNYDDDELVAIIKVACKALMRPKPHNKNGQGDLIEIKSQDDIWYKLHIMLVYFSFFNIFF